MCIANSFVPVMEKLGRIAGQTGVVLKVLDTGRPDLAPNGQIEAPAKRSNHMAGHAVDFHIMTEDGVVCDLPCLKNYKNAHKAVVAFIHMVKEQENLSWGGTWETPDPVHIDSRLSENEALFEATYRQVQEGFNKKCSKGCVP